MEKPKQMEIGTIEQPNKKKVETGLVISPEADKSVAVELKELFDPLAIQAQIWADKAKAIVVTSPDQVDLMVQAREARLNLKDIRLSADKVRKDRKEQYLRNGRAVDGAFNIIKAIIVPIEEHLKAQEDFVKREEDRIKRELSDHRVSELSQYEVETQFYNLGEMSEEGYKQLLDSSRLVFEQRRADAEKAEQERIAEEKARAEKRKAMEEENARLKKEAEERERIEAERAAKEEKERQAMEAKLEKERKAAAEKLQKEKEERERVEAELQAKREAEEKAKAEAIERERQAKLAPDKVKLEKLAVTVTEIPMPDVTSKEAKDILRGVSENSSIVIFSASEQNQRVYQINGEIRMRATQLMHFLNSVELPKQEDYSHLQITPEVLELRQEYRKRLKSEQEEVFK